MRPRPLSPSYVLALALILSSMGGVASADTAPDASWRAPGSNLANPPRAGRDDGGPQAYLTAARTSLIRLGAPTASQAAADGSIEFTVPAGRLDGDQNRDVITSRFVPRSDYDPDLSLRYTRGYDFTIRGRSGSNGQALWTYTDKAAAAYAMPMRLATGDGVMVASYEINYLNGSVVYTWAYSLKLTVLDRTGTTVWTKTFAGPYEHVNFVGGGGAALPVFRGFLDAVEGPAEDVLVDSVDSFRSNRAGQHPVRVEAIVLDGATGSEASRAFRTVRNADYDLEPFVIPAGDLDGDGLDDCLFVMQASVDAPAALSASSGDEGEELWRTEAVSFAGISIAGLGDATGDGADDLAVGNFAAPGQPGVFLLSGRTGGVVWSGPGRTGFSIGDATGDGRPDMGLLEFAWDGSTLSARLAAVDGQGRVAYSETRSIGNLDGAQSVSGQLVLVGDVDSDAATDSNVKLSGTVDGTTRSLNVLVSGSTGDTVRELDGESPLGGSTDGDGADLLRLAAREGGGLDLTVTDGATGDDLWQAALAAGKNVDSTLIFPVDLGGDGRDEIVANDLGSFGTELKVHAADGSIAWTG